MASLNQTFRERMHAIVDDATYSVRLSVDEVEDTIRTLWELVGHMADDVGPAGYEHNLLERARHHATQLQAAMLAGVATEGPRLQSLPGDAAAEGC